MWSPTAIVILKLIRWAPKPSRKWQEQNVSDGLVCMKDVANQKNLYIFTDISIWMRHTVLYFRNIQSRKCSNIIKWERERSYQSLGAWIVTCIAIAYSLHQNHELYDTLLYKQNIDNFNIDIFLIITSEGGFSTLLEIPRHPIDELYPHCLLVILCLSEYFQSSSVTSSCFNWKQK